MKVFTLGTGDRHPLDFGRVLAKYGVEVIFDVRRLPLRETGFDRDALQRLCDTAGVGYIFLGNELGSDLGLRTWASSEAFTRWLAVIRRKLETRAVCLLCRESSPERCRRRVIAEKLATDGVEVVHILDTERTWRPAPGEPTLLEQERARESRAPGRSPGPPGRRPGPGDRRGDNRHGRRPR